MSEVMVIKGKMIEGKEVMAWVKVCDVMATYDHGIRIDLGDDTFIEMNAGLLLKAVRDAYAEKEEADASENH